MCGICGFYLADQEMKNKAEVKGRLEAMTQMLYHRGPDDHGYFIEDGKGLGFRRLSIIDLNMGSQPQTNEDETLVIVYNGEIYNYLELREILEKRGHRFKTKSDTEVLVHLYEDYGVKCLDKLRGMFAFVIYDRQKKIYFGARDFFGIKPLYYSYQEQNLVFASEIKSILACGVKREVNQDALYHYLTFQYVPDPLTMFQNIFKVPPGHYFLFNGREFTLKKYWEISFHEEDKPLSYFIEGTRELIKDSVQKHSISDVPVGAFLSSGIDSTAIASILRQQGEVNTYTVGFDIDGYNEVNVARDSAKKLQTRHKDLLIDSERYFNVLPDLIWYQDEPVADPSAVALYFVARLASKDIKVVLSGEGADEIFGGYNIYKEPGDLRLFSYMPLNFKKRLNELARKMPDVKGKNFIIRGTQKIEDRFFGNALIFPDREKKFLKSKVFEENLNSNVFTYPLFEKANSYSDSTKMQFVDLNLWLPGDILSKADKMTMANSLELRVPFLDKEIFNFARTIPAKYKIHKGVTKYILREAMKGIVPETVVNRKKLGFPVPIRVWLRGRYYNYVRHQILNAGIEHLIDLDFVMKLLEEHRSGKKDNSRKIWTFLVFAIWYKIYFASHEGWRVQGKMLSNNVGIFSGQKKGILTV